MSYSLTKREELRKKLRVTREELEVFRKGCERFIQMQVVYDTPEYNAFGQRLRPHYCVHGVSNLWADYDDICMYCEDGISTPVQWGLIVLNNYRLTRNQHWYSLILDSLRKNHEGMNAFVEEFGSDYLQLMQDLRRSYGVFDRGDFREDLLRMQFSQSQHGLK